MVAAVVSCLACLTSHFLTFCMWVWQCGEEKGVNPDTFKQQRAQQERDMANMAAEILRLKTQALNPAGVQSMCG